MNKRPTLTLKSKPAPATKKRRAQAGGREPGGAESQPEGRPEGHAGPAARGRAASRPESGTGTERAAEDGCPGGPEVGPEVGPKRCAAGAPGTCRGRTGARPVGRRPGQGRGARA